MNGKKVMLKAASVFFVVILIAGVMFTGELNKVYGESQVVDTYEEVSYDDVMTPKETKEFHFYVSEGTKFYINSTISLWGEYEDYETQDTTCCFYIKSEDKVIYTFSTDTSLNKSFNLQEGKYTLVIESPADCYVEITVALNYDILEDIPTYKEVSKKARSLATKNIKYKNLDVGYHSRLYGKGLVTNVDLHTKELYAIVGTFQPYIDIKKNKNSANLRLAIKGKGAITSYLYEELWFDKVRFYTKDRTTTFDLGDASSKYKYDYSTGIYTTTTSWWSTLSSDSKPRYEQLNKLITIFKHKNVRVRVYEPEGAYIWMQLSESQRKNWLGTFQKYKKLLAMY